MYFVVVAWQGKFHCFKTTQPQSKPIHDKLGQEVERYLLSEEQWQWSLNDLMAAREMNILSRFTIETVEQAEAFWSTLGLPRTSTEEEVKERFRALALKHHPDVGGSARVFIKARHAYEAAMRWFERRKS